MAGSEAADKTFVLLIDDKTLWEGMRMTMGGGPIYQMPSRGDLLTTKKLQSTQNRKSWEFSKNRNVLRGCYQRDWYWNMKEGLVSRNVPCGGLDFILEGIRNPVGNMELSENNLEELLTWWTRDIYIQVMSLVYDRKLGSINNFMFPTLHTTTL